MAKDILLGDKEFMYEETETGFTFARRLDENMRQGVFLRSPLSDHDSFIMGLREYFKDHKNINLSDIQIAYEKMPREDVWIMNDKQYSSEPEQTLKTHKEEIMATNTKGFFDGQSSTIEYTDEELKKYFGNKKKIEETADRFREKAARGEDLTAEEIQAKGELYNPYDYEDDALERERAFDERALEIARRERSKNLKGRPEDMALQNKDIVLGDTPFLIKESPERMIIFDKKTGEGCVLLGDFDKSAIKKDLTEAFKDWHGDWDISINDIGRYIFKHQQKGNDAYINIDLDSTIDFELEAQYKKQQQDQKAEFKSPQDFMDTVQLAKKAGYVQGVCECLAVVGDDHALGKKLLSEMNVTRDMARKFAKPETYKFLEQGIFAPQQKIEQTQSIKR